MGIREKGIDENQAKIIVCENNFHGRTTTIISFSNDENARKNFGPYTQGFIKVEYDNLQALEQALTDNKDVAGFWLSQSKVRRVCMCHLKVILPKPKLFVISIMCCF